MHLLARLCCPLKMITLFRPHSLPSPRKYLRYPASRKRGAAACVDVAHRAVSRGGGGVLGGVDFCVSDV